ncbi:J domain-containing protein [Acinetobacter junii]|uniref:J domain-containing protein n=2 Tax=Acinetobacter junii TaxID=40215 RepID=UPI00057A003A|nr:DnaJ domain-containing protein [Acinetobacter junii]
MLNMNLYEVLHVSENAPEEVIRLAYKGLAQKFHPDRYKGVDANEKMVLLRKAYETLTDETKRAEYDKYLHDIRAKTKLQEEISRHKAQEELLKKYQDLHVNSAEKKGNKDKKINKTVTYIIIGLIALFFGIFLLFNTKTPEGYIDETDLTKETIVTQNETNHIEEISPVSDQLDNNVNQEQTINLLQDDDLIRDVVNDFDTIYKESGITGLISSIEECYKSKSNIKYCFYLDTASRYLDHGVSLSWNTDVNPFFENENFGNRVLKNFYIPMGVDDSEIIHSHLLESNALVAKKLAEIDK